MPARRADDPSRRESSSGPLEGEGTPHPASHHRSAPPGVRTPHRGPARHSLPQAQQLCGERLRQRHNTTLFEATTCEAPREVGLRVMAISACVAAAVFSVQVFARG